MQVCEGELPLVRIYNRHMKLSRTIHTSREGDKGSVPLRAIAISSVSVPFARGGGQRCVVPDVCLLCALRLQKNMICLAMSDLSLSVYQADEDMTLLFRLPCFTYPQTLFWSEIANLLYCGGADGIIRVYNLETRLLQQTLDRVRAARQARVAATDTS